MEMKRTGNLWKILMCGMGKFLVKLKWRYQ